VPIISNLSLERLRLRVSAAASQPPENMASGISGSRISAGLRARAYPSVPVSAHVGPYDPIVKKAGEGSQQQDGYTLEFAGNNVVFWVYISGTGWVASPQASVPLGQWSYVAGTYSAGSGLSLYVNGQLVGTTVVGGQLSPSGNTLDIGHDPSNADRWYDGLIDEPSVYNRALSPAEIQWIYNAGSAGKRRLAQGPVGCASVGSLSPVPSHDPPHLPPAEENS
jgi:hypothetical protein